MEIHTGLKKRIMRNLTEHKVCMLTFGILFVLWMVIAVYMKYAPFGDNSLLMNDAVHQYYPLFGQYRDRLLSGDGIFYSAGGGLGFNFYAIWTYYLSSPLNLVLLFFPASQIDAAMDLLIMAKIILCGTAFAYYLGRRFGRDNYGVIPFACGYALSSFVLGYCYNIMWMDCLVLFPVIVAGLEKLIKEGKWKQYTVSLALCLWCSFYISFMICLFLVLWFLFCEHASVRSFLKRGVQFALSSVLSAAMACVVLLPAYMGIVQSQAKAKFPDFDWMGAFSEIFAGKEGGIFAFSDPISLNNEIAYPVNLYCGVFVLGLTVLYFLAKDVRLLTKLKMAWMLVLFVLSFNHQALNFIWHGFHYQVGIPNRFAFLMIFVLLLVSCEAFLRLPQYPVWQIILAGILSLGVYGSLYFLQKENITTQMLVCTLAFTVCYPLLWLFRRQEEKGKMFWFHFLLVCMCLELSANAVAGSKTQVGVTMDTFYRDKSDLQAMSDTLPDDQYRTELSNPTVKNEGMAYNLPGSGIFSSTTNIHTIGLLHDIGFSTSSNAYISAGATPVINMLFGIKNYLIIDQDVNRLDAGYEKKETVGSVTAYENRKVLPIAYLCQDTVRDWSSMHSDFFTNQMDLLKLMTGKDYQVFTEQRYELKEANDINISSLDEHQQFTYLDAKGARNDHAVFEAVAAQTGDLYLRLQASYSNKTSIYVNDKLLTYKDLSSSFYHIGQVEKGDTIRVEVGILENSPTYGRISMSMYAYHKDVMEEAYRDLHTGALNVTKWKEGYIQGTVTAGKDRQTLFTTIPYDKGWSISVDGKKQKVQTVHGGFLMAELEEGTHEVVFSYQVPGLLEGGAVSALGILIFAGLLWRSKRRKTGQSISIDTTPSGGETDADEDKEKRDI